MISSIAARTPMAAPKPAPSPQPQAEQPHGIRKYAGRILGGAAGAACGVMAGIGGPQAPLFGGAVGFNIGATTGSMVSDYATRQASEKTQKASRAVAGIALGAAGIFGGVLLTTLGPSPILAVALGTVGGVSGWLSWTDIK